MKREPFKALCGICSGLLLLCVLAFGRGPRRSSSLLTGGRPQPLIRRWGPASLTGAGLAPHWKVGSQPGSGPQSRWKVGAQPPYQGQAHSPSLESGGLARAGGQAHSPASEGGGLSLPTRGQAQPRTGRQGFSFLTRDGPTAPYWKERVLASGPGGTAPTPPAGLASPAPPPDLFLPAWLCIRPVIQALLLILSSAF